MLKEVSILVLMEDPQKKMPIVPNAATICSFNPCFNGRPAKTKTNQVGRTPFIVSILVLMEDPQKRIS